MTEEGPRPLLDELLGEQLSAVTFVQNYLQLWFDRPGINVTNPLTVRTAAATIASWQPGFRDLLCGQIAKVVAAVEYLPRGILSIGFGDGSGLSIALRHAYFELAEAYCAP